MSLLCHKGTHLRSWHCKMGWTSKPSPGCWATTQPNSPWTPTPTSPPPRRGMRRIRWAASSPVLSDSFRTFRRLGQRLGQGADPSFCSDYFDVKTKKVLKSYDFRTFLKWSDNLDIFISWRYKAERNASLPRN